MLRANKQNYEAKLDGVFNLTETEKAEIQNRFVNDQGNVSDHLECN